MRHTRLPTISLAIALLGVLGAPISCNRSSAPAPTEPFVSAATAREPCTCLFVGGDARDDRSHVVQWALRKAREQNACAFVFLGDMELNPQLDVHFQKELAELGQIPFYPVLGNHEVKLFGIFGIDRKEHVEKFKRRFLDNVHTPIKSELRDRVAYSVDLSGGVHFVALDNVAEPGFGKQQLAWLRKDLTAARANSATRHIVVGMHKALAANGVTNHSMDEDGEIGKQDSAAALAIFRESRVDLVIASHLHTGISYVQGGIRSYITGGLGAPIARETPSGADRRHHVLRMDFTDSSLNVTLLPFEGATVVADKDEDEGKE